MKNKILLFTLLTIFGFSVSKAGIVYTDVNPDTVLTTDNGINTFYMEVDLNNDNTPDYKIGLADTSNYFSFAYFQAGHIGTSNYLLVDTNGGGFNVIPHNWVPQIGPSSTIWHSMNAGNGTLNFNIYLFPPSGLWLDENDHYVACKFLIGSSYHYGWMRLQLQTSGAGNWKIILKDYAYESTANTAIAASTEDIFKAKPQMNVYQSEQKINFSVQTEHRAKSVEIIDLQGKVIRSIKVDNTQNKQFSVNAFGLAEGIYAYRVNFEDETVLTGKTFISSF